MQIEQAVLSNQFEYNVLPSGKEQALEMIFLGTQVMFFISLQVEKDHIIARIKKIN